MNSIVIGKEEAQTIVELISSLIGYENRHWIVTEGQEIIKMLRARLNDKSSAFVIELKEEDAKKMARGAYCSEEVYMIIEEIGAQIKNQLEEGK